MITWSRRLVDDDRFAIAQSRLDAMKREAQTQNTSWRALLSAAKAADEEPHVTDLPISDADVNRTINTEIDRRIDSTSAANDPDARFGSALNTNLFERLKDIADQNGYSDVAEGIGIGASIMEGFSEAGIGRGRRSG